MSGKRIQIGLSVVLGILVLIAFPAPTSVGVAEVAMALISFAILLHFLLVRRQFVKLSGAGKLLAWALIAHVTVWMGASLIGIANGIPIMTIVRNLLPQILFAPIVLVGMSLEHQEDSRKLANTLFGIGLMHAIYLVGLGVFAYSGAAGIGDLELSRITFLDPRTTMPLFLACVPFGLAILTRPPLRKRLVGLLGCFLAVAGAFATQTRAQLLAIFIAVMIFGLLYLLARPTKATITAILSLTALAMVTIATVPTLRNLALTVVERQRTLGDNARLEDEWLPALHKWEQSGPAALAFGIGLGVPTPTFSGEEKTYIHNQVIYMAVYTGLIGSIFAWLIYGVAAFVLARRFLREKDPNDAAACAAIISLVSYALFFAVHKIFSFNLMIALLFAIAMRGDRRPESRPTRSVASLPLEPIQPSPTP